MKTPKNLISFVTLCFSLQAHATDYLMFIGAGGEPAKQSTTLFDSTIKNMATYVNQSPGLKVNVALNGGHSKTEEIIKNSFPGAESKTNFQESDYKRLIENYKKKLENNEMVSGDQFMIYVDSHGAQKYGNLKTHAIATSEGSLTNLNTLAGASVVNLDQLEELKKLAKAKGVKMAIIDGSCHSGNTQSLADENTCVISSTGPNHYAYSPFSENFSASMVKGKNLEEIFLETRGKDITAALPMISTQSGQEVTDLLYKKITPFLYHFDNDHDKLTPYLKNHESDESQCLAEESYSSLVETIKKIEELNTVSKKFLWWTRKKMTVNLTNLKSLLASYENSIVKVQSQMKDLGSERLNQKEIFRTPSQTVQYSWRDLLTTDYKTIVAGLQERLKSAKDSWDIGQIKDLISTYDQANLKKEELIKAQPDLANIIEKENAIKKSISSNYFTAAAIGIEERKLYAALYKSSQEDQPLDAPNPCRDFKL